MQVVIPRPILYTGTALSGHTFEVYDRQFREWHMQMVCARRNLARWNLGVANDQQDIVIFWLMDRPSKWKDLDRGHHESEHRRSVGHLLEVDKTRNPQINR